MKRYKGRVLVVKFYDHVMDALEPAECICVGVLQKIEKNYIVLQVWDCLDHDDNTRLENSNFFCILRSTIIEAYVMEQGKKIK